MSGVASRFHRVFWAAIAALTSGEVFSAEARDLSAAEAGFEEIVVTATKKERAQNIQEVPIAVTAFGSQQLEALNFQNLTSLSYTMPNVAMDSIGTTAATANFSIRGLGINSSIPSIDPTVGVFVDGVYMGINAGVLFDNFDLDGIEVLRGPQGVLFGRNVTGGAVVVRTKAPSDVFGVSAHFAGERGPNFISDATITGPLVKGVLDAKLALYRDEDRGLFTNLFNDRRFGASTETILRPALRWTPTDRLDVTLRYEHGAAYGDGAPAQNHALYSRDSFDFAIDDPGHSNSSWDQAFAEANWNVAFGKGKVTSIFGWRKYYSASSGDIDSTPQPVFHALFETHQDQRSEELRYAGTFGPAEVTTGLYYFQQNIRYGETRLLDKCLVDLPAFAAMRYTGPLSTILGCAGGRPEGIFLHAPGGGKGDFSTEGAFAATDYSLTDAWKLNLGVRYTHERKQADVTTVFFSPLPVFSDSHTWSDVSPRIGFQWFPAHVAQLYGYWAKGFRSGGYNFRNTDPGVTPGPFDSEKQSSFELGWKQDLGNGRARVNLAAFHNKIKGLQREINVPGALGVTQVIRNTGDATIVGGELEATVRATRKLTLSLNAGYTHGKYDSLKFDLDGSGDSSVSPDSADYALQLPRLSPWTWGGSAVYDLDVARAGVLSSRVSFTHRDRAFYTDNNRGFLNKVDRLDVNLTWLPPAGPLTFAVYGTNLLNKVSYGGDTQLPPLALFGYRPGGPAPTFSPLNKGRVYGAEVRFKF
jgi:iron complex outermembrane receptor protein